MKKIMISIFLSCSLFLVISCFYCKATGKPQVGFEYILHQFEDAEISYDIEQDIKELETAMNELKDNNTNGGSDIFSRVGTIAKTLYYCVRFFIKLCFHSLIAALNVLICCCNCIGFNIPYVHLTEPKPKVPFAWSGDLPPIVPPFGI